MLRLLEHAEERAASISYASYDPATVRRAYLEKDGAAQTAQSQLGFGLTLGPSP